jgi:hypothetical protein
MVYLLHDWGMNDREIIRFLLRLIQDVVMVLLTIEVAVMLFLLFVQ